MPLVRLAEAHGLPDLISAHVSLGVTTGANPAGKAMTIVAGMCAGADGIDDLDMLRTGGMDRVFGGIYAPSTIGRSCGRSPTGTYGSCRPRPAGSPPG